MPADEAVCLDPCVKRAIIHQDGNGSDCNARKCGTVDSALTIIMRQDTRPARAIVGGQMPSSGGQDSDTEALIMAV